jgi:putative transferase (TIGR04331 family)
MSKYFLVTTPLESTWDSSYKTIFLGEWCKLYKKRFVWKKIDTITHEYHWDDREKYYSDYLYLGSLYEKKLSFLSQKLGKMHGVTTNTRFWRIIIGPWLRFFMDAIFDRYENVNSLNKAYKVADTSILDYKLHNWTPSNFNHFYRQLTSDVWNHVIFSECIKDIGLPYTNLDLKLEVLGETQLSFKDKLINKVFLLSNKLTPSFLNKIVIVAPYIGIGKLFKWQLKLRQLPFLSREQNFKLSKKTNKKKRNLLKADEVKDGYERLLDILILNLMPLNYVENFHIFYKKSLACYPKNPSVIYTANAYQASDSFKFWLAHHTEKKTPFILGQHGGNMGIAKFNQPEDHQICISDIYASWGWLHNKINVKPIPSPQLHKKIPKHDSKGDILLAFSADLPRYFYCQYSVPVASQVLGNLEEQINFIERLDNNFRENLKIRLVSDDFGWDLKGRLIDSGFGGFLDMSNKKFIPRLNNCRLMVSTSNTTTFLETLSLNFPTIVFFNPIWYEVRKDAKILVDDLRKVGILHDTPESAANLLNTIGEDIDIWWGNNELQKVREKFCEIYALKSSNWIDQWHHLFDSIQNSKAM